MRAGLSDWTVGEKNTNKTATLFDTAVYLTILDLPPVQAIDPTRGSTVGSR